MPRIIRGCIRGDMTRWICAACNKRVYTRRHGGNISRIIRETPSPTSFPTCPLRGTHSEPLGDLLSRHLEFRAAFLSCSNSDSARRASQAAAIPSALEAATVDSTRCARIVHPQQSGLRLRPTISPHSSTKLRRPSVARRQPAHTPLSHSWWVRLPRL